MKRGVWISILIIFGAAIFVVLSSSHRPRRSAILAANPAAPAPSRRPHLSPDGELPSPIAADLDSPRTDIHADLRILNDVFVAYRSATHGLDPVGENKEITAVLTGRNALGFAFVAPDSPAINADGELVDRWGNPFFFHALAGDQMEIRSAGPDHRLYTSDDFVLTPGRRHPQL